MKLMIIGAGVAGLAAAQRLRTMKLGLEIVIFEKSRGVGGRVATRRFNGATFDHGAQYVKTPSAALRELLTATLAHDSLHNIDLPVWTFDHEGKIGPGDAKLLTESKWSWEEGNTQLAKELARGLDVRFGQQITHIERSENGWTLWAGEQDLGRADAVLMTPPAPQTGALIEKSNLDPEATARLTNELNKVHYRPCLTITLGYPRRPRPRPFYALVNTDKQHPVSWLALEHIKEGRKTAGQGIYILQMAPQWSLDHWDDQPEALAGEAAQLLTSLLDQPLRSPLWSNRQGWRFALPDGRADPAILNAVLPGLYFAGDYTAGQGRVHLAIEQGWAAAAAIAQQLKP
ncbi:MAG: FAD-dependent oxidoreductase [Herpetosiphonaceae bacterium]|nr:FAD-dependent oxidoreductase [Herpetosiphonaceae bacterium]